MSDMKSRQFAIYFIILSFIINYFSRTIIMVKNIFLKKAMTNNHKNISTVLQYMIVHVTL